MRGQAGSVLEISVSGLEILPYEHFRQVTGMKAGWVQMVRMASSCIAGCIFHIISIPFNGSDTALRVAEAMIGAKVKIFVFCHVCFVSRIWHQNSSPVSLAFSLLEPKMKFVPVTTCRLFSRGVIFTRARVSLALLSLRKNGGLLVV